MTCITTRLDDVYCIHCNRSDQVYMGHGQVRFCAHCSISWDPIEDGEFDPSILLAGPSKTVVIGEEEDSIPADIQERMGLLAGQLVGIFDFDRRMADMMAIPEALFTEEAIKKENEAKAAAPWRKIVAQFTRVMALIHLSLRLNPEDQKALSDQLLKARTDEFKEAVSGYIAEMECGGQAELVKGPELKALSKESRKDAKSIVNTYNKDLANAIDQVKLAAVRANRHTFAKRLRDWYDKRSSWKNLTISTHTVMTARDSALKAFAQNNGLSPSVLLWPRTAKEPICQGWINRGEVRFQIAVNNPSPFHVGCVHYWKPVFDEEKGDCEGLWVG